MRPVGVLRCFFGVILAVMLAVTTYASLDYPIWRVGERIGGDAWFHATLADAYCGFLSFYAWVFWLERGMAKRLAWLVAILALGNIAMAGYALIRLLRLPADASAEDFLIKREVP